MSRTVDPELRALIAEAIEAGLLGNGRRSVEVARRVAETGQASLSPADRDVWEVDVLPVLAKPLGGQIAVRAGAQRGRSAPIWSSTSSSRSTTRSAPSPSGPSLV